MDPFSSFILVITLIGLLLFFNSKDDSQPMPKNTKIKERLWIVYWDFTENNPDKWGRMYSGDVFGTKLVPNIDDAYQFPDFIVACGVADKSFTKNGRVIVGNLIPKRIKK